MTFALGAQAADKTLDINITQNGGRRWYASPVWVAIGGNNMLLYLAALTNVPQELYEAAEIDGAGKWKKFWNVTWPQLAPTTFPFRR